MYKRQAITKLNGIVAGIGGDEDEYATVMTAIEGKITAALKDIASGATKVETVSYTHLDVYKRQRLRPAGQQSV